MSILARRRSRRYMDLIIIYLHEPGSEANTRPGFRLEHVVINLCVIRNRQTVVIGHGLSILKIVMMHFTVLTLHRQTTLSTIKLRIRNLRTLRSQDINAIVSTIMPVDNEWRINIKRTSRNRCLPYLYRIGIYA